MFDINKELGNFGLKMAERDGLHIITLPTSTFQGLAMSDKNTKKERPDNWLLRALMSIDTLQTAALYQADGHDTATIGFDKAAPDKENYDLTNAIRLLGGVVRMAKPEATAKPAKVDLGAELTIKGARTGVFLAQPDPTTVRYIFNTNTLQGHQYRIAGIEDANDARKYGVYAHNAYRSAPLQSLDFRSFQMPDGLNLDSMTVKVKSAADAGAFQKNYNALACTYVRQAKDNIAISLLPPYMLITPDEFRAAAKKFEPANATPLQKYVAGIKAVIEVFNNLVARPHQGEIVFRDLGDSNGKSTVVVDLLEHCADCKVSSLSVSANLRAMLKHFMKVDDLRVTNMAPGQLTSAPAPKA